MVKELERRKALLKEIIESIEEYAAYADALFVASKTTTIVRDMQGTEMRTDGDSGLKLRAYNGSFHEECVPGWDARSIRSAAGRLKSTLAKRGRNDLNPDRKRKTGHFSQGSQNPATIKEKTLQLERLHAAGIDRGFLDCHVAHDEITEQRIFVNKYKQISSDWTGCTLTVMPIVRSQETTRSDFFRRFSTDFQEVSEQDLAATFERAKRLEDAKRISPGEYDVILSPNVAGLLAHESFGHGMEADTMLAGRALAEKYREKKVAPVKVSICEDPSLEGTHGFLFFDDEGNLPERVFLIDKGIVKDPITNLFSSARGEYRRSANGRTEGFDRKIFARMTNTFFLPGTSDPEKMISKIKNGFYLHHGTSGMEDPRGWGVQIAGIIAERIRNGKMTGELFSEVTLGGFLPDILKSIKEVGSDFNIHDDAGFCAKGHHDWVRVSSGGPSLLIRGVHLS